MQIPIQNIYFLLCYAWDKLEEKDSVNVQALDTTELVDLFAKVLINGTARLLKQGLDRYYVEQTNTVSGIRGKLNLSASVKRHTFAAHKTVCVYDEFDYDILHNQILKTIIRKLLRTAALDPGLRDDLHKLFVKFPPVSEMTIRHAHFKQVRLHRNNYHYDFILKVCRILHEHLFLEETSGEYTFQDFVRDEKAMARLFEAFVRNFYKIEQSEFRVTSEVIRWKLSPATDTDLQMLPVMITDISLISPSRKMIVDTKFYKEAFRTRFTQQKINSAHLYQLFSYLKNQETDSEMTQSCEGVLLYPAVGGTFQHKYQHSNHTITVRSLDLNQDWENIRQELLQIIA